MGKYYCDYCDIYLTHDSMSARKAHNTGRNHISNVRDYFAGLGHDKAQNIIDAIIQSHETGGRQQMMAAPSMRLGAGFLNPTLPPNYPPFPAGGMPPQGGPPNGFQGGPPPFRPPFPPTGQPSSLPPFPPNQSMPPFPPGGFQPPPQQQQQHQQQLPSFGGGPSPTGPITSPNPPSAGGFTPAPGPPAGGNPGIHPDRLRMLGGV